MVALIVDLICIAFVVVAACYCISRFVYFLCFVAWVGSNYFGVVAFRLSCVMCIEDYFQILL